MRKSRTISLRTIAGFKRAENLKARGWKVGIVGWDNIQLYKEAKKGVEK